MTTRYRRRSLLLTALAVFAIAFVFNTLSATTPAYAHATVVSSDPADGQVLAVAPTKVEVRFSETVSFEVGGLTVLNSKGARVDNGDVRRDNSNTILSVGLERGLGPDTYVINYRVTSGDGHPMAGGILFGVGPGASLNDAAVAGLKVKTDPAWEITAAVARFITYTAALVVAGLACFLAFVHDQRRDRWKLAPVVRVATLVTAFGALLSIAAQAALVTGRGLSGATDLNVLRSVLSDRLGWASVILLVGLALAHLSTDTNNMVAAQLLTYNGGLMITCSFALWGHTTQADNAMVALISDAVHATAGAIWLGGLVGLSMTLAIRSRAGALGRISRTTGGDDHGSGSGDIAMDTARIVSRFSTLAAASVVAIAVSGSILARSLLPGPGALVSTTYGRLLLTKIAVVVAIVAVAGYNRFRLIPSIRAAGAPSEDSGGSDGSDETRSDRSSGNSESTGAWARLISTTRIEAVAIVVVLSITAVLVGVSPSPAKSGVTAFNATVATDKGGKVSLSITPNRAGPNTLHIQYYDANDQPDAAVTQVRVEFLNLDKGLGPIVRDTDPAGSGHFTLQGSELSIGGKWDVSLVARISQFDEQRTTFAVDVSK